LGTVEPWIFCELVRQTVHHRVKRQIRCCGATLQGFLDTQCEKRFICRHIFRGRLQNGTLSCALFARIDADLGILHKLSKRRAEARSHLMRARPVAESLGATGLLSKIDTSQT
jgi:hypothetical protein